MSYICTQQTDIEIMRPTIQSVEKDLKLAKLKGYTLQVERLGTLLETLKKEKLFTAPAAKQMADTLDNKAAFLFYNS